MTTIIPQETVASLPHTSRRGRHFTQRLLAIAARHNRGYRLYFERPVCRRTRGGVLTIPEERSNREHQQNGG